MPRPTIPRTGKHTGIPTPQPSAQSAAPLGGQSGRDATSDSQPSTGTRVARNNFERALLKFPQKYIPASAFASDAVLDRIYRVAGLTEDELPAARKRYHEECDVLFPDQTIRTFGFKPVKGERVRVFDIPNSHLSIRLWDGGLEAQGQYCLDFIDARSGLAENSPCGWTLHPYYPEYGICTNERLKSWEEAWKVPRESILDGEERFSIGQGAWCGLERPGVEEVFWIEIPGRRLPRSANGLSVMVDQGQEDVARG